MNQIPLIQNSQKQLERLSAQREIYASAKRNHGFQIVSTALLPVILAIISLINDKFAALTAIYGVSIFIFDIWVVDPMINKKKVKAAKIQELFDCDVLQMPKSTLKTVDDVAIEEVLTYYDAHAKIATNVERVKDWYSPNITPLKLPIARLLCQRSNCWWDSKLRRRYAHFLKYSSGGIFFALMLIGFFKEMTLVNLTLIAAGMVPFFQFSIKQANDNIEASTRLNELCVFAKRSWENALLHHAADHELLITSRMLQDEIFEHRKKSPLILDLYYNLFRDKDEMVMNKSTSILVAEALSMNTHATGG